MSDAPPRAKAPTPLAARLMAEIAAAGPIGVDAYMAACLLDPTHGYYATREPFGQKGDFTTAPEISQMFGELLGLALAQSWLDQGAPARFTLAELGPGRGTLMADLLRATATVPGFLAAAEIHLVEASPRLRAAQADRLSGHNPSWHDHTQDLPQTPLYLIANEFFDALPIRQYLRLDSSWAERRIGLRDGRLAFGLGPPLPDPPLDTRPGDILETCPMAPPIMAEIATRIARHGGTALILDYGDWQGTGDTLQALHQGRPDPPLAHPGQADLTAHVQFAPLAAAARAAGAKPSALTPQGTLLQRLGIDTRAARLAERLTGPARASHLAAHRRLTAPQEMGTLFKALAVVPPDAPPPPGFDP